ncbi:MAG: SulP family inorganic anion transporter [Terriglobales bacterium]
MALLSDWSPKFVLSLKDYTPQKLFSDLLAGITVGLVALPLAMAFAIASGMSPQAGLYTAVLAGFLISLLGGSSTQIGGPTGAFVVVVAGIIDHHGVLGLFVCTLLAGLMLIFMGVTGLGTAVRFIPRPVVVGFTNGIAVLIASTQIKDFFGLTIAHVPGDFWGRMTVIARNFGTLSPAATTISAIALAIIVLTMLYVKRVPGYIIALLVGTGLTVILKLPVETIGSRFGGIPSGLPHFQVPHLELGLIRPLIPSAITIAMLGAIESLMSAVVSDRMSGDRHNPNVELIAQGIANVVSPLVGGLPATGAIARTATNIRSGAKTPVAGMVHALTLLAILLFAAPLAKFIPLSVLAAILMVVAYNMGEWTQIPDLLRLSKLEIAVWLITFLLTVFADLTVAVEMGMILAVLIYLRNVTSTTTVTEVTDEYLEDGRLHILQDKQIPPYAIIFRIHGPFLFGATDKIHEVEARVQELPAIVILRLRNMTALDATGLQSLEEFAAIVKATGRGVIFCGALSQPSKLMKRAEFEQHVGAENICANVTAALARAEQMFHELPEATRTLNLHRRSTDFAQALAARTST